MNYYNIELTKETMMKTILKICLGVSLYVILTAQGCQEITPTSCSDVEVFYGPLVETYGHPSDDNPKQQDRFYLARLYYKSSNPDLNAIKINFNVSNIETVNAKPGISVSSSPDQLLLKKSGNGNLSTTGKDYKELATIAWRVKYTNFNSGHGRQQYTFLDHSNLPFSDCQPSFIIPPSLTTFNNERIERPASGYTPPPPIVYDDVKISNTGQPVYICVNDGKLTKQVSSSNECTSKYIEIRYQYTSADGIPLKMLRNDVIPRQAVERLFKGTKGAYNDDAWWCDNGDIIRSKYCKSCGPQKTCKKLTFKM